MDAMLKAKAAEHLLKKVHLSARRALLSLGDALTTNEIARREYQLEELWLDLDGPVGIVHALGRSRAETAVAFGGILADCAAHLREIYALFRDIEAEAGVARFLDTILRPSYQNLLRLIEEEKILGNRFTPDVPGNLQAADRETSASDRLFAV